MGFTTIKKDGGSCTLTVVTSSHRKSTQPVPCIIFPSSPVLLRTRTSVAAASIVAGHCLAWLLGAVRHHCAVRVARESQANCRGQHKKAQHNGPLENRGDWWSARRKRHAASMNADSFGPRADDVFGLGTTPTRRGKERGTQGRQNRGARASPRVQPRSSSS